MLNSGVLRLDPRAAGPATHAVSAALFASYPYWLWRGWRDGRRAMTAARFPHVAPGKGHYESFYLRAVDPERPRGVWIRHTTHQRPGRPPTGSVWCTLSDAEAGRARTPSSRRCPAPSPTRPAGSRSATARSGRTARAGGREAEGRSAAWELAMRGDAEPLRHLPREWMYRAPLPRTKLESPLPSATFDGTLEVGERGRVEIAGWRGMAGHNWGAEHAETLDLAARRRVRGRAGRLAGPRRSGACASARC